MKNMGKWVERVFRLKSERGAVTITVAISMAMFIGFVALAVDIGYLMVTRNELQNVADASALAGARWLGNNYEGMSYAEQQLYVCNPVDIIAVVNNVAGSNQAGGNVDILIINDADVIIGQWDADSTSPTYKTLTPTLSRPNAVRVTARRDGSANGPIATFFAGILGINTAGVTAFATAALTGQSTAGPGGTPFPAGISRERFESEHCDQNIQFYPTTTSCAGWHTYTESPSNAAKLRQILDGLTAGTYVTPEVTAGDTLFTFTGGTLASAFDDMVELFDAMKVKNDGVIDADDDSTTWTTSVVVYDGDCAVNPTGAITIVGFATATITTVTTSPSKTIQATIKCEFTEPGRGGGGSFGTLGSIPGLVQ